MARIITTLLIEFAGCSGSGKTTLAHGVAMRLRAGGVNALDRKSTRVGISASLSNAVAAVLGYATVNLRGGPGLAHTRRVTAALQQRRLTPLWKVARTAATYRLVSAHRRAAERRMIEVVDEGLLTTIALAFGEIGQIAAEPAPRFLGDDLVPDLIVYVDCNVNELVSRIRNRSDPPNELARMKDDDLRRWLASARSAYSFCLSEKHIRDHVIRVSNEASTALELEVRMDDIAAIISDKLQQWPLSSHRSS